MKRIICAALALALGLVLFCSCGKKEAQEDFLPEDTAISLDEVKLLAALGNTLTPADLPRWEAACALGETLQSSPSESRFALYTVEGGYRLIARAEYGEVLSSVRLENIWDSVGIDIRAADIDAFVRENPSSEAITVQAAREILVSLLGGRPKLEEITPQVSVGGETCHVFFEKKAMRKYAVGNRTGVTYEITTDAQGNLLTGIPIKPAPTEESKILR